MISCDSIDKLAARNEANVSQHDSNAWLFVWGAGDGAGFASMPFIILVCPPRSSS